MLRYKFVATIVFLGIQCCFTQTKDPIPHVKRGKIVRIPNFQSKFVSARTIDVWLPEGYYNEKQAYEVLYMHDGQMLFDSEITWNKQAWCVADIIDSLIQKKRIRKLIVVGIWNGGTSRHADYFPQKPYMSLNKNQQAWVSQQLAEKGRAVGTFKSNADNYLKFMVYELKPYIDQTFSVNKGKDATYVAGSSMGGLISLYALCEYPHIFGGAACLSTHWPGVFTLDNNPVPAKFFKYLSRKFLKKHKQKLYFDCGDQTLDALYPPLQLEVDKIMRHKKINDNLWLSKFYPGTDHSEKSWSQRFAVPLIFLFGQK